VHTFSEIRLHSINFAKFYLFWVGNRPVLSTLDDLVGGISCSTDLHK